ncbi:hypothetical protein GUJ93_ZPchr0301g2761, partial [Zizania palustris]
MAMATTSVTSLAMAMAAAADASPAPHKLAATLPFHLFSRAPLLRASRRLPLAPLVASSDARRGCRGRSRLERYEAGVVDELPQVEDEVVASGEEDEVVASGEEEEEEVEDYAVEPPEEAKVYIGNLPYDVDSEGPRPSLRAGRRRRGRRGDLQQRDRPKPWIWVVTMATVEEADKAIEMLKPL